MGISTIDFKSTIEQNDFDFISEGINEARKYVSKTKASWFLGGVRAACFYYKKIGRFE